ncbi:MAG TPA: bacillithiol biosynthesis BshC [Gemmatimonadaceae bacterium]|nr:bacillithiol biosynthesis BshC [Gemmatimonadaceae bacterium]
MTEPIVRTEALGGSELARAAMDGRLGDWYAARPTTAQGWKARADAIRGSAKQQRWLDALRPAFAATGAAASRLERVVEGRGVVVTTGQQPGLFGGPIYTWSKALSALALADEIEAATGVPTAPVFWAANDDADFAEASWTAVAMPGGAERLALTAPVPVGRPMSDMPLGDASAALLELERACGATIDPSALVAVREAYHAGATVGSAYLNLLRAMFEPLGIAVLDAAHSSVGAAMRPLLVRALDRATDVASALKARDSAIASGGFSTQVIEVEGLSLVFERPTGAGDKRRIPLGEATTAAAGAQGILSPNVLLRPVLERALLPTVSYVAGPGELAYFAQVSAVATALDLDVPMVVPRWSTTILEPHVVRILSRLGIEEEELADPHRVEGRLARNAVPRGISDALGALRADLDAKSRALAAAAQDAAYAMTDVVEGMRKNLQHRLGRLDRRIVAAVKRREHDTMTQVGTVRGSLYPLGTRQERALNMMPLLARHGAVIVERMRSAAAAHARALVGTRAADDRPASAPRTSRGSASDKRTTDARGDPESAAGA